MKILIVEDDPNKLRQLDAFFVKEFSGWEVLTRHSYQSGLKAALVEHPDIVLLDMTMPTYDDDKPEGGGRERRYAGEHILKMLYRKKVKCVAIVVTMFERFGEGAEQVTLTELDSRLSHEFHGLYIGSVFYQAAGTAWVEELRQRLSEAQKLFRGGNTNGGW